jgi:glutaredoxin
MIDTLRSTLHQVIASPSPPAEKAVVRVPKMLVRRLNRFLGSPICSAEELATRRAARAKLAGLGTAVQSKLRREPAPVVVYHEKDRNQRLLERVEELLRAREIAFRTLDVTGDEATMAFIMREAKCEEDDLPIIYVAGQPVGGYNDLVEWDVAGRLKTAVFG